MITKEWDQPVLNDQRKKEILKARAEKLAKPLKDNRTSKQFIEVIVFMLANETYALEAEYIREVYPLKDYTSLPGAPPFVFGLINVRRKILPLIDLKTFFDLPASKDLSKEKIIILADCVLEFGILTEEVLGVRNLTLDEIQSSLPSLTGVRQEFLKGVTSDRLVVLDGNKLLTDKQLIVNETID